jgi:sterol desaturase/sphingolipid hydroxylase (fatty acid hydroxylase superfamily)
VRSLAQPHACGERAGAAYVEAVKAPSAPVLIGGLLLGLWLAERRRPLRERREDPARHDGRNLAVAALGGLATSLLERPIVQPLAGLVARRRWGLVQRLPVPAPLQDALAVVLMDYTLYLWHVLTHRSALLWRLHQVHHADLDLTASTALRFHFGEMIASVPWRAAQVLLIGTGPRALTVWRRLLLPSIVFHHTDLRLPAGLERRLAWLVATPRLHGVHHAAERSWSDSNWSSGLTLWDRLHGTYRSEPVQPAELGVEGLRRPEQVRFGRLVTMPFGRSHSPRQSSS